MEPTLRQLEYLVALADEGHFGRAARRCAVSQPALSTQLRQLERVLGAPLVERTSRRVQLTPTGAEVAQRARSVLAAVRELGDVCRAGGEVLCGLLRLGVIPTIAPYLLPRVLPAVRRAHPGLRLQLREDTTARLLRHLREGTVDVVLLALPVDEPGVETLPLFREPFVVALPAGHELTARDTVSEADLVRPDLLLLEEGHCLRDQALEVCGLSRPVRDDVRGSSLTTLVQMVANGLGFTLLPASAAAVEPPIGSEVVVRPLADPAPGRTVGLAWRASSPRRRDYRALGALIGEHHAGAPAASAPAPPLRTVE